MDIVGPLHGPSKGLSQLKQSFSLTAATNEGRRLGRADNTFPSLGSKGINTFNLDGLFKLHHESSSPLAYASFSYCRKNSLKVYTSTAGTWAKLYTRDNTTTCNSVTTTASTWAKPYIRDNPTTCNSVTTTASTWAKLYIRDNTTTCNSVTTTASTWAKPYIRDNPTTCNSVTTTAGTWSKPCTWNNPTADTIAAGTWSNPYAYTLTPNT